MLGKNKSSKENIEESTSKRLPRRNVLMVRILAGVYLLYLAYSMIGGLTSSEVTHKYVMGFFIAAFVIIGGWLILFSGRSLMQGYYIGGEMDADSEAEYQLGQDMAETVEDQDKIGEEDKENLSAK